MCVQNYPRRSKSTRPQTATSLPKEKPSKHLKTQHYNATAQSPPASPLSSSFSTIDTTGSKRRRRKSVTFNETVMVRPLKHGDVQKSVCFHEVVMVRPVLHLTEYSDQEIADCWYVLADKQRIKYEILNTLKKVKDTNGNTNVCTRGLEKLSDGGRTRERRRISIREVLDEQDSQRAAAKKTGNSEKNGKISYDSSKFRKAYKPHSRAARHVAHAVGKIDEMAANATEEQLKQKRRPSSEHKSPKKSKPRRSSNSRMERLEQQLNSSTSSISFFRSTA